VRVYPPVSLRLPSAVLPALLKRQLTISRTSAEFMQAYRKDTIAVHVSRIRAAIEDDPKDPQRILTVRGAGYVFAQKQDSI
ncbi:MAG: winged helix-turn-helix domain-containing protein, partial [Gammaproteobacteria bacterium]